MILLASFHEIGPVIAYAYSENIRDAISLYLDSFPLLPGAVSAVPARNVVQCNETSFVIDGAPIILSFYYKNLQFVLGWTMH